MDEMTKEELHQELIASNRQMRKMMADKKWKRKRREEESEENDAREESKEKDKRQEIEDVFGIKKLRLEKGVDWVEKYDALERDFDTKKLRHDEDYKMEHNRALDALFRVETKLLDLMAEEPKRGTQKEEAFNKKFCLWEAKVEAKREDVDDAKGLVTCYRRAQKKIDDYGERGAAAIMIEEYEQRTTSSHKQRQVIKFEEECRKKMKTKRERTVTSWMESKMYEDKRMENPHFKYNPGERRNHFDRNSKYGNERVTGFKRPRTNGQRQLEAARRRFQQEEERRGEVRCKPLVRFVEAERLFKPCPPDLVGCLIPPEPTFMDKECDLLAGKRGKRVDATCHECGQRGHKTCAYQTGTFRLGSKTAITSQELFRRNYITRSGRRLK